MQSGPRSGKGNLPLQENKKSKKTKGSKLFKDEGYTGWLKLYAPREDDPPPPRRTKPTTRQLYLKEWYQVEAYPWRPNLWIDLIPKFEPVEEDESSIQTENSLDKLLKATFGGKQNSDEIKDEQELNLEEDPKENQNKSNTLGFGNGNSKKHEKTKEDINIEISKKKPEKEKPLDLTRPMNKDTYMSHLIRTRNAPEMDKLLTYLKEAPTRDMMTEVLADKSNYPPMVYTFLKHDLDITTVGKGGITYLHGACHKGNAINVALLLKYGDADPNVKDNFGQSALHHCCAPSIPGYPKGQIAKMLLDAGAHVNARDKSGQTPLHYAARTGGESVQIYLLAAGANITIVDDDGQLPYDCARSPEFKDIMDRSIAKVIDRQRATLMYSTVVARRAVREIMKTTVVKCNICKRPIDRCQKMKEQQYLWWLFAHDKVPS